MAAPRMCRRLYWVALLAVVLPVSTTGISKRAIYVSMYGDRLLFRSRELFIISLRAGKLGLL